VSAGVPGQETWNAVLPNLAKGTTVKQDPPHLKVVKRMDEHSVVARITPLKSASKLSQS